MKLLFKLFLSLVLGLSLIQAAGFEKDIASKTLKVHLSSQKSLVVGSNIMKLQIKDGEATLKNAKVSVKVFMPAMPGMPAMQGTTEAKVLGEGEYEARLNFSMSGTWQIHILIKQATGKKVRIKTSITL